MEITPKYTNIELKGFQLYADKFRHLEKISIPYSYILEIQKIAISRLGLNNINQLRDKFEGQAFLDKLLLSSTALFIFQKYLRTELNEEVEVINQEKNPTLVIYRNKTCRIIPFIYGTLPDISMVFTEPLIFCAIQPDMRSGRVLGILESYKFDNVKLFNPDKSPLVKSKKFIGFNNIMAIEKFK